MKNDVAYVRPSCSSILWIACGIREVQVAGALSALCFDVLVVFFFLYGAITIFVNLSDCFFRFFYFFIVVY
jgi:hypothetical protein